MVQRESVDLINKLLQDQVDKRWGYLSKASADFERQTVMLQTVGELYLISTSTL